MQGLKINKKIRKHSLKTISIVILIAFFYAILFSSIETPTGLGTGETM